MINVIGQFFGTSGYANHVRYLANALSDLTEVSLQTQLMPNWESQVNDKELKMIKLQQDNEVNLIITHPLYWRVNAMAKRNFAYLVWEGDKVPDYFIEECLNENIERIIVPSVHTADALYKTANELKISNEDYDEIVDKVVTIPHGVDLDIFYPIHSQKDVGQTTVRSGASGGDAVQLGVSANSEPSDTFKFLANKGLTNLEDRGGLQYLIEAYVKEFKPNENVELILKINTAYGVPNLLEMFPYLKDPCPKITVIAKELTTTEMNELYNNCDVFVSPTRGEAFNIPCLEAMACGKPVITTDFGGQTDFVEPAHTGILLDYDLKEVKHDIQYEGIQWATPSITGLKTALRNMFENRDIVAELGDNCIEKAASLTWNNTAKQLVSLI